MKNLKAWVISVAVICIVMVACGCAIAQAEDRCEFYPKLAVVFDTEQIGNSRVIYCVDKAQNVWSFYDDEGEWDVGDIANLLMWKLNEDEEYDEIVEAYWEGYTEGPENLWGNLEWW